MQFGEGSGQVESKVFLEASNGFGREIYCIQKPVVGIKGPCIIKVLAGGDRYKLHLSPMSWGVHV